MGCDKYIEWSSTTSTISIHAARMGCDRGGLYGIGDGPKFQSTQPEWAATVCIIVCPVAALYFNPRSPNGLRLRHKDFRLVPCHISIHAARMGCDKSTSSKISAPHTISIHAARMGCDQKPQHFSGAVRLFQSTQPEWAATSYSHCHCRCNYNFNPRSPNGLRPIKKRI